MPTFFNIHISGGYTIREKLFAEEMFAELIFADLGKINSAKYKNETITKINSAK